VLPLEVRFGTLDAAQRYTDGVVGTADFARRFPRAAATPLRLRTRRGDRSAHYSAPDTIAVHAAPAGSGWALREMVLLHEIAHHAAGHDQPPAAAHGPAYTGTVVWLVTTTMGPETGLLLTTAYAEHGVAVTPIT
jgi:putative metallohydrolase (TIGR04338 family)